MDQKDNRLPAQSTEQVRDESSKTDNQENRQEENQENKENNQNQEQNLTRLDVQQMISETVMKFKNEVLEMLHKPNSSEQEPKIEIQRKRSL